MDNIKKLLFTRRKINPVEVNKNSTEEEANKQLTKLQRDYPGYNYLFMGTDWISKNNFLGNRDIKHAKNIYAFFDIYENLHYYAEGRWNNQRQFIKLFNSEQKEIGNISENLIAMHSPFEYQPTDFTVKVLDQTLGLISTQPILNRFKEKELFARKLNVKFMGWEVKIGIKKTQIYNRDNCLIGELIDNYFKADLLCFTNKEDELMMIIVMLTLNALKMKEERKRK